MEITREAIEQAVESYRQEMLDYWKELVNFQAGSKEGERMFALLSQVNAKLNREGFASELLPTGSPIPLLRAYLGKERPLGHSISQRQLSGKSLYHPGRKGLWPRGQ